MLRRTVRKLLVPVLLAGAVGGLASASAADPPVVLHGLSVFKGCESPVQAGDKYECSYGIQQNVAGDTAIVTSVTDTTATSAGPMSSGNILSSLVLTLSGGATCNSGQTSCTIPAGGEIDTDDYSYYTVVPADYTLADHELTDEVSVGYTETCVGAGASNCPSGPQVNGSGSSAEVDQYPSSTVTTVQSGGMSVTEVPLDSTVTDQATVSGTGPDTPTGTVTFTFFSNGGCTGTGKSAGTGTLAAGVATSGPEASLEAGSYSFQATYNGDDEYESSTGACEPLTVSQGPSATTTAVQLDGTTVTSVPLGAKVTDQATVTGSGAGTPTGTVTFTFYTNDSCSGTGTGEGTETLAAGVANSPAVGPLTAGTDSFQATYNGDSNYTSSTGNCEPFTVQKATSATVTSVLSGTTPVTSVALGTTVTDQATVSGTGAGTPTGTVAFTFYTNDSCTGTGTSAGTGTLSSGVANSGSKGPLAAGSYSFQATYNGDGNYLTSTGTCEPLTVGQGNSMTVTTVQLGGVAVTGVALGSTVTDQATVSGSGAGTPTGTVGFTFYSNGTCSGSGTSLGSEPLVSGVANSSSEGPLMAGSYSFKAVYSGDSNYLGSTGACEPLTVNKASSATVTTVQQGGSAVTAVALGTSVTDQATVSGTGAGTPTGTVTFTFFSNNTCSGTGTAGTPEAIASGVANSASQGPLLAGSYSFQATYNGDSNYLTSTGTCEPLTVNKAASQTVTAIQSGGQTVTAVALGSTVTDQATVSGTGAGTPTGTVTFTFFSNSTCTGAGTTAGTGTLASGVATSSPEGSLTAGSYSFQATYSGDANYLTSTGACEPLTVNKASSATVTTVQQGGSAVTSVALGTSVTDQATVSGTGAGTPTGTVTFTFFANGGCTGTGTAGSPETLTAGVANSASVGPLDAAGPYSFQATYNGDSNYLTSTGGCEPLTVNKASSATVTIVQQGGSAVTSVALGTSVTDQATVSGTGAGTPTGTVTFTFFSNSNCTGSGTAGTPEALASGVANSASQGPLLAGSYSFQATYNGDANYLTSTGLCEPFTVGTGTTVTITTVQQGGSAVTSVALGTSVTDQATVSGSGAGTPTGTVTFTFFANGGCTGTGTAGSPETLTAGVANSASVGPLDAAGPYSFQATYNGDSNYKTSIGICEPFAVMMAPSLTVTTVQQGGAAVTTVALGSSVTDQATVTGSGAGTPTGTVTFTFFANGGCTGTGTAGSPETLTAGVANSASVGPLDAAGPYSFQATYNGDSNYVTSTGACEPFAVGPGSTVTVTTVQQGGSTVTSVALGTSVTDQAMVSGSGAGTPTGTVTFTFFTNDSCTGTGTVGTAEALTSGVANSSSEGPLLAGSYSFQATYSGDANYLTSTGGCEPFTVSLAPSVVVTTVQQGGTNTTSVPAGASVTDQATVSGSGAGTPTGMVTFTSFANGTCAGTGTPAGTGTLASGVANSNTVGPLTVGGSYSFQATYNGDANYLPQTGSCEPFTVVPPVLTITKTADAASVPAGNAIGFTVVVSNGSPGTATSVTVNDPLPAGSGISWSITPAYSGPGSCSITGSAPTQVLTCALGDMAPGASASVHIQSATTAASVGTYKNTATASATNAPSVSATASIMVTVPIIPHTSLTEKASVTIENNEIPVTFTYSETNTGTVGITGVAVTGSLCGPATFVSSSNNDAAVLDPGATWIYTCTYTPDNKTAKVEKFVDMATATGTSVVTGLPAPLETAKATVKVRPGPGPCGIAVAVSPNPLVETGQSEVHAVVQVEACAAFAGDLVMISSPQLTASCAAGIAFSTLQPGPHTTNSIQVVLDDDGNATVSLDGTNCAPGPSVIEASLVAPPYLTAVTTLTAVPPQTTTAGVVGYPANEVETGDTAASGLSDVYAVFYVETNPVYAEQTVEISSPELLGRCLGGVTWTSNTGTIVSHGATDTATLDNDGNAVFTFKGSSCASGTSTVIGDVLAGTHTTYQSTYTIDPPVLTPS